MIQQRLNSASTSRSLGESTKRDSLTSSGIHLISESHRSVSFRSVRERYYPLVPGVSPAVLRGPPLSFDWDHIDESYFDFEKYEKDRKGKRRATLTEMKMSPNARIEILRENGHPWSSILQASKAANIGRRQRNKTVTTLLLRPSWVKVEEKIESYFRALKKPLRGSAQKQHEKELRMYYPKAVKNGVRI